MSRLRIVVTGLIAQHPNLAGVTWDYVQYPLGLARLGHDVYYVEDSGEWPYNTDGGVTGDDWVARDCTENLKYLRSVFRRFGLEDRWAYFFPREERWFGLSDARRQEVLKSADLLINVSGTLEFPERYRMIPRLAYVDSDPGFTQVKALQGDERFRTRVDAHDVHFSFGERMRGKVPRTPHTWLPTRQPIVLSEWTVGRPSRDVFTTIMNWTSYKPLVHEGVSYAQKDVEFVRFLKLPSLVGEVSLEVAIRMEHADWSRIDDRAFTAGLREQPNGARGVGEVLERHGWRLTSAAQVGRTIDSYRDYIETSAGEWSVAKNGYVTTQSGWFSCRSACYLAAGKPVVVQDTGFGEVIPVGLGLFAFREPGEAADAIHRIRLDPALHGRAARALAVEYFASDRILSKLIDDAMDIPELDPPPAQTSLQNSGSK